MSNWKFKFTAEFSTNSNVVCLESEISKPISSSFSLLTWPATQSFIHHIHHSSKIPLPYDRIFLHEPNSLVYDPPATVLPFSASLSSLSCSSNLSLCQLLHQRPSHTCLACSLLVSAQFQFQRPSQRWSWFNLFATLVSQTRQSPSQWHHNPSSHKFILNNHRTAGRWEGSLFQLNFNTHCKQSWFNLLATYVSQTHQSLAQQNST